jgi:hypothetical protein
MPLQKSARRERRYQVPPSLTKTPSGTPWGVPSASLFLGNRCVFVVLSLRPLGQMDHRTSGDHHSRAVSRASMASSRLSIAHSPAFRMRSASGRNSQKHQNGTAQSHQILISETTQPRPELAPWNGRDFVNHQAARRMQAIVRARRHQQTKQRSIGRIGRERADGDRIRHVKMIILNDHYRSRFARVILAARSRPDLATPHPSPRSVTASMKAWSSWA